MFALLALISATPVAESNQGNDEVGSVAEIGDAPEILWGAEGLGPQWQKINPNNVTYFGKLSINDSVDVFALENSAENWTKFEFSVEPNENVTIIIQRLNQTSWSIDDFANGSTREIELNQGIHAVRIERLGNYDEELEYRFSLTNLGTIDVEGKFVNLSWMFTPFYVFAGSFLILPFLVVLWWNRNKFGIFGKNDGLIQDHERSSLLALRERFANDGLSEVDFEKIRSSLDVLAEESWSPITEEFGPAEIRYFTNDLDINAWRLDESGKSILIGIKTAESEWNMAAIRIFSPFGEEALIEGVEPELLFQKDEVFIGDLLESSTFFLRIKTERRHAALNMHFSGLIRGNPVAVVPKDSIRHESE